MPEKKVKVAKVAKVAKAEKPAKAEKADKPKRKLTEYNKFMQKKLAELKGTKPVKELFKDIGKLWKAEKAAK